MEGKVCICEYNYSKTYFYVSVMKRYGKEMECIVSTIEYAICIFSEWKTAFAQANNSVCFEFAGSNFQIIAL